MSAEFFLVKRPVGKQRLVQIVEFEPVKIPIIEEFEATHDHYVGTASPVV